MRNFILQNRNKISHRDAKSKNFEKGRFCSVRRYKLFMFLLIFPEPAFAKNIMKESYQIYVLCNHETYTVYCNVVYHEPL